MHSKMLTIFQTNLLSLCSLEGGVRPRGDLSLRDGCLGLLTLDGDGVLEYERREFEDPL